MQWTPQIVVGIFDLIKGLAWPVAVLLLALIFRTKISASLPALLGRVTKLKVLGAEVEVSPADQQQKVSKLPTAEIASGGIALKDFPGLPRTIAMANLERELHSNLKQVTDNQVDLLIRNLAQARLEAAFGIVYVGIFGSQIEGLQALEARRKVSASEAYEFYKPYEDKYPEAYANYGFAGWLGFLKNRGLVEADGDDIRITSIGDDFLLWLRVTKFSTNKPW